MVWKKICLLIVIGVSLFKMGVGEVVVVFGEFSNKDVLNNMEI